jgi:hypothetical protein
VAIQVHPEATAAILQKGKTLWFLVFNGPNGVRWSLQTVTHSELNLALECGHSDADVVSYIEGQLVAAGYEVVPQHRGTDAAAWAIAFSE